MVVLMLMHMNIYKSRKKMSMTGTFWKLLLWGWLWRCVGDDGDDLASTCVWPSWGLGANANDSTMPLTITVPFTFHATTFGRWSSWEMTLNFQIWHFQEWISFFVRWDAKMQLDCLNAKKVWLFPKKRRGGSSEERCEENKEPRWKSNPGNTHT